MVNGGLCPWFSRRSWLISGVGAIAAMGLGRIGGWNLLGATDEVRKRPGTARGRLAARPGKMAAEGTAGLHEIGTERGRGSLVYVPPGYRPDRPGPMAVMLHGAGGSAENGLGLLRRLADEAGLIVLAPSSRHQTWDGLKGHYGPDVAVIDAALEWTFNRYAVDARRIAIGGFSDGGSYALSLGLINGDLFSHVVAFSPGFVAPGERHGRPRAFVSHGTDDRVLPIDLCSRRIVPRLRRAGYDVHYREFDGPHAVPADVAREAIEWFRAAVPPT
jgi:phospholipase/carboxylesterase